MLTTKEAAEILGISPSRIRQLILEKRLPATKHGRDLFIRKRDLKLIRNRPIGRPRLDSGFRRNDGKLQKH